VLTLCSLCTGHMLGVTASWVVQVGMELYRFFRSIFNANVEDSNVGATKQDTTKKVQLLGQKVALTSIRCGSSLVFASIGAGIGATLVRPSLGQWIGKIINNIYRKLLLQSLFLNCVSLILIHFNFLKQNLVLLFRMCCR